MKKLTLLLTLIFLVSCNKAVEEKPFEEKSEEIGVTEVSEPAYVINALEKSVHDVIFTGEPLTEEIIELANSKLPTDDNGKVVGIGGDEGHPYKYIGDYDFDGIPYTLFDATGKDHEEIYEWLEAYEPDPLPTSIHEYPNALSFIEYYDIPKEKAKEALIEGGRDEETANIIVYGSDNEIMERFTVNYSVIVDDKYYSPSWLLNESVEKWKEVGITKEMLLDKVEIYSSKLYSTTRDKMSAKFSEFFGSKVELKTVEEIIDESFSITVGDKTYNITQIHSVQINDLADMGITSDMLIELQSKMTGFETSRAYDNLKGILSQLVPRQTVFGKPEPDAELPVVPDIPAVTE